MPRGGYGQDLEDGMNKIVYIALFLLISIVISCTISPINKTEENEKDSDSDDKIIYENSISFSQFGITWTFDKEYEYGQFANGDYWIVGPVKIIDIQPSSVVVNGRTINGSMINPSPEDGEVQGYDSAMYENAPDRYDAEMNFARPNGNDLSGSNILTIAAGNSLVSTISLEESGARPQLKSAAVLTILNEAPQDGSFRPAYSGDDKTVSFNKSNINYTYLEKLAPVDSTPEFSEVERYFERPWIDHNTNYTGRFMHPVDNMPDYGREIATQTGVASLMLHLDYDDSVKVTLLVRFIQLGIDLKGLVDNGGGWMNNGGHASGRKWPILFAGIMLEDDDMKSIGDVSGMHLYSGGYGPGNMPPDYVQFGEDEQTFYVTQDDVDRTNGDYWNPDDRSGTPAPYEAQHIGIPEWGKRHATDPYRDNYDWEVQYRDVASSGWNGYVFAARIMEDNGSAMTLWNHPPLFDYVDRYMQIETDIRSTSDFTEEMWDTYRVNYGDMWSE